MPDVSAPASAAPLADFTTLRLGGRPRRLVTADNTTDIIHGVRDTARAEEPLLILAGGSNVVVDDGGFPGTVLLLRSAGCAFGADGTLTVEAGVPWDEVVAAAVDARWAGIECLSGIPGSAGATPIQNVGAYGQEVAETVTAVRAYDRVADEVVTLSTVDCGFGYRTSVFRYSPRWVVLDVTFRLTRSATSTPIRYAELAGALGVPVGATAPLADVRKAVLALRAAKGMVLDPADPDTYSAGSFFLNPVLDAQAYARLDPRPPAWPNPEGSVKVSAAALIERAGFAKGFTRGGGVAISSKHTLALTNRGTGTTAALLDLARVIRAGVHDRFGVLLHPEPVLVNCEI